MTLADGLADPVRRACAFTPQAEVGHVVYRAIRRQLARFPVDCAASG